MDKIYNLINDDGIKYETNDPNVKIITNWADVSKELKERLDSILKKCPRGDMVFSHFFKNGTTGFADLFNVSPEFEFTHGTLNIKFHADNTPLMESIIRFASDAST
jgi:hypothetical protein